MPTPAPLAPASFVGRGELLLPLQVLYRSAAAGRGTGALLRGEAGIGKTSVLRRVADAARGEGARVLLAHGSSEPSAPALWPWIEILRNLLRSGPAPRRDIRPLLCAFAPWLGGAPHSEVRDRASEPTSEFQLSDSLIQLLLDASTAASLCLVLEDLHEFDAFSHLLLRRLMQQLSPNRIFVLASCRTGVELSPDATDAMEEFEHDLLVPGLQEEDVHMLLEQGLGRTVPVALASSVHQRSEGNPLYVRALVSMLVNVGAAPDESLDLTQLQLPGSVRLATQSQLDRVSASTRRVLRMAAVFGREIAAEELSRCETLDDDIARALTEACRAGVLLGLPDGRHRFSHVLLREVLERELDAHERSSAHADAARALSSSDAGADVRVCARTARHWLTVGDADALERAVHDAQRAGRAARERGAHSEAAENLALVVAARRKQCEGGIDAEAQSSRRRELTRAMLELSRTLWPAGQLRQRFACVREAALLARSLGDAQLLTQAALIALDHEFRSMFTREDLAFWEEICGECISHDVTTRVRLRAGLAYAWSSEDRPRAEQLASEAEALVASTTDVAARLFTLRARLMLVPETDYARRQALLEQHNALATDARDPDEIAWSHAMLLSWSLEAADPERVRRHDQALASVAPLAGEPMVWWARLLRCTLAMLEGRWQDAQRLDRETRQLGRHVPNADLLSLAQWVTIRRAQGPARDIVEALRLATDSARANTELRASLARSYVELERFAEARMEFSRARAAPPANLSAACALAECAYALNERNAARELYEQLEPHSERCVCATASAVCRGAIAHFTGLAALAAGSRREGIAHLERALAINRRMGALPSLCATHCELARALHEDGRSDEARQHALDALRLAQELAMPLLVRKAERAVAALQFESERAPAAPAGQHFVRQGDVWQLCYRGRSTRVTDLKGMHYLAALLARPGQQLHVLELIMLAQGSEPQLTRHAETDVVARSLESYELNLDGKSIAAYRRRVSELAAELEDAERMSDLARKQTCLHERELLLRELASGTRARHRPTERARKAVYNRIRQAVEHIERAHAELGRHLVSTIKTGAHCAYCPEDATPWELSAWSAAPCAETRSSSGQHR